MTADLEVWARQQTPWLIVDQKLCDGRCSPKWDCMTYSTHYICGTCIRDLSELTVHHVVCCPYCGTPLPALVDVQGGQEHIECHAPWPYDLLASYNRPGGSWCDWWTSENQPMTVEEDGAKSWPMVKCVRLKGHEGLCRFDGPHEMPPRTPFTARDHA